MKIKVIVPSDQTRSDGSVLAKIQPLDLTDVQKNKLYTQLLLNPLCDSGYVIKEPHGVFTIKLFGGTTLAGFKTSLHDYEIFLQPETNNGLETTFAQIANGSKKGQVVPSAAIAQARI